MMQLFSIIFRAMLFRSMEEVDGEDAAAVPDPEIQQLKGTIEVLSRRCSTRAFRAVSYLFRQLGEDVEALYRHISNKNFCCYHLRYVGPVTYPEVHNWCEEVKQMILLHHPHLAEAK